mgnify:CR=1 FL=1
MDEKTKAQIQQEAADLVAKLQPRSGKFRTISPEMDPLRLGSGWSIEDLDKPQVIIESTFGDSHPGSATVRPRATTASTTRCPAAT